MRVAGWRRSLRALEDPDYDLELETTEYDNGDEMYRLNPHLYPLHKFDEGKDLRSKVWK